MNKLSVGDEVNDCVENKITVLTQENASKLKRIVVKLLKNGKLKYGYTFSENSLLLNFYHYDREKYLTAISEHIFPKNNLVWSHSNGVYIYSENENNLFRFRSLSVNRSCYQRFRTTYSAFDLLQQFESSLSKTDTCFSKDITDLIPFTFGIEFETSNGTIPPKECLKHGLMPLRDGSISGFEYATTILSPKNNGFERLKNQINLLSLYTESNTDCSVHIHFGGHPIKLSYLYTVYNLCKKIEKEIIALLPELTFNSGAYKSSGKDYCKKLPNITDVKQFYKWMGGVPYLGSLNQPHPADISGEHKWQIQQRYLWVNMINSLFYNKGKTIEFRCLQPTINFNKLVGWIFLFSGILKYAVKLCDGLNECEEIEIPSNISLNEIFKQVYPEDVVGKMNAFTYDLISLKQMQEDNGDNVGALSFYDSLFFNDSLL
jgi:hypothetical protein